MKIFRLSLLASAAALLSAVPAFADTYTFTLSQPVVTIAAGSSYTFSGTLFAPMTNTGDLSITSETVNADSPLMSDTDIFNKLPFTLSPGQTITGDFFSIMVPSSAAPGTYLGSDSLELDDSAGNPLFQSANFSVNATAAATTVTPEPGSWLLLSTGLGAVGLLRRRFAR